MQRLEKFFAELKRRKVFRVASAYLVAAWGLSMGAEALQARVAEEQRLAQIEAWKQELTELAGKDEPAAATSVLEQLRTAGGEIWAAETPVARTLEGSFEELERRCQVLDPRALPCRRDSPADPTRKLPPA